MLDPLQYGLGAVSGALVGFSLGLLGGGGSILATPLIVYLVGVRDPHVAIGTSALAVAVNALTGLAGHARAGEVKWRWGAMFAAAGVLGALGGSLAGKAFNGQKLLFLFAILMVVVGVFMLRARKATDTECATFNRSAVLKALGFGLATGLLSGFFGIGGGFLIVPGLIAATGMAMINAIGTSLMAVAAFGFTTAGDYAFSGLIDWGLAAAFIGGGIVGGTGGTVLSQHLTGKGTLKTVFAYLIFVVAAYMLWKGAKAF